MAGPAQAKSSGVATEGPSSAVVILADDPTSVDELGGHLRVASAIAALIHQGVDSGRSIALTGSWGSGKSSIIRMLSEQLESTTSDRPPVLVFDAWNYQGDALRRAFLEQFIDHAARLAPKVKTVEKKWPDRKPKEPPSTRRVKWTEDLDLITGRRESSDSRAERPLTGWGLAVAIYLLLCLPLGTAFLSKYEIKYDFWRFNFALLFVATYAIPIVIAVMAWVRAGFKADALKALLLREATQDTSTTTVKTKEPSSADFRKLFNEIASYLMGDECRRLVIVVDNLDRIDAAAAVTMWATMRIFFDSSPNAPDWQKRIWLIVPFDRSALEGLWQSPDGKGNDFVESFLNKTFQIAFHVSPPVLTTWKDFLQKSLNKAFPGTVQSAERDAVYELFALRQATPSPREIKMFINKVAALRLLWSGAEQIDLPFLAAYVLHQKEIKADGSGLLLGEVLSREAAGILLRYKPGVDCGGQLAAAHFNVSPGVAIQVLVDSRFTAALAAGNQDALVSLRKSANFWTVFERFAQGQLTKWQEPETLARVVKFLSGSESPEAEATPFITRIWPTVLSSAASMSTWGSDLSAEKAAVFPVLLGKAPDGDFAPIATGMLSHLQAQVSATTVNAKTWVSALRDVLGEIQKRATHATLAQNYKVTAAVPVYISIVTAALDMDPAGLTLQHVDCSAPADVPRELAGLLSTMKEEDFLRVKNALESSVPSGWDAFDTNVITALPSLAPKDTVTAIRAILQPRTGRPDVEPLLTQVSPTALSKFGDAGFESRGQWREAGVLAAAVLVSTPTSLPPALSAPVAPLMDSIADALLEFGLSSKVFAFSWGLAAPLLDAIVRKGRFDDLDPEAVLGYQQDIVPGASGDRVVPAAKSDRFLQHVLGLTILSFDHYPFLTVWLKGLADFSREKAALHLGTLMANQAFVPIPSTFDLLNEIFAAGGVAWLPLAKASELLGLPSLPENLKSYLSQRTSLGDRTVQQLLEEAEKATPAARDALRDLAIDRARGDYASAAGDRSASLLAWGEALLARGRRGPWQTAKSFAERAQHIFIQVGQP
jgi:hypothetical protein